MKISTDHDFFLDLGGHSLLAATFVSELRKIPQYQHASMIDVYNYQTIQTLAIRLDRSKPQEQVNKEHQHTSAWRYFLCAFAQGFSLYFILGVCTFLGILGPYMLYHVMIALKYSVLISAVTSIASLVVILPTLLLLPILAKWLVIGRYQAGEYPLWGTYYFRWWFVHQIAAMVPTGYMIGTPFLAMYLRLLGAKIGKNAYLAEDTFDAYDLIEIGDNSSLGNSSMLMNVKVEDGLLKIGKIKIGKNCYVGTSCAIESGAIMQDGSALEDLSLLPVNTVIPQNETWRGSPAQKSEASQLTPTLQNNPSLLKRLWYGAIQFAMLFILPAVAMLPLYPTMLLLYQLNPTHDSSLYMMYSPLIATLYIVFYCLEMLILKWLVLGRIKPGTYSIYSSFYLRKWMYDQFMTISLGIIHPLYATLYLIPWYRMLGMKIGKHTEVSTATMICPDALELGNNCFIADGVFLGAQRVQHSQLVIGHTSVGNKSFVGNSAVMPSGAKLGDHCLIGCLSIMPDHTKTAVCNDSSWFGSPSVLLPRREKLTQFAEDVTFNPSKKLILQRLSIEFIRAIFPLTCYTILFVGLLAILFTLYFELHYSLLTIGLILPILSIGFGLSTLLITWLVKKLVIGNYQPTQQPLWSLFVWRTEFVTSVYESLAAPFFISMLVGTPYVNWALRLLGCKIGKRVFTNTTDITEFDMIEVDDQAELNFGCNLQTHLFEDRIMKVSRIVVGKNCTIGALAVVLYDTTMENGSSLGALSMLMKGETLPANTEWRGSPARLVNLSTLIDH